MLRQSTYISFYEEAEIPSNPLPDCEPVSVNHSRLVSLWKAILMSFGGKRQSFSRSFGILGVLWKSLRGAAMDQKLDNSPTSLQLLNLCTSCYPFKLNQHSIHSDERAAILHSKVWPPPPRISIKVFKLFVDIAKHWTLFLWHFVFFSLTYHCILWHWTVFFDIVLKPLKYSLSSAEALGPQIRFY